MPSSTKTVLKKKQRLSFLAHAVIWIVAIAGGTAFAKFVYPGLVTPGRVTMADREQKYKDEWAKALKKVRDNPPPAVEGFVEEAAWGQRGPLQTKLDAVYKANITNYNNLAAEEYSLIEKEFRNEWDQCYEEFTDTPKVDDYCQRVHEFHREALKKKLQEEDNRLRKLKPRTRIALDAFSGYCILRSKEFRARAKGLDPVTGRDLGTGRDLKLHLMDDGAEYEKRINALKNGDVEMAVFTLDALISNSALFNTPPAQVVMVLDETRGADAMLAYKQWAPDIASLNRPSLEVFVTRNSPSELLARLVGNEYRMPKLMNDALTKKDRVSQVFEAFQQADPKEPKVFVLWEPFVSRALQNPDVHVLRDSSHFKGSIIDVLVARKEFLDTNRDEVEAIVRTYLETVADVHKTDETMAELVRDDAERLVKARVPDVVELTPQEARNVVRGIQWKTTADNYRHFGLASGDETKLEDMIRNIGGILTKAKVITKQVKADQLYDKNIIGRLKDTGFDPSVASVKPPDPVKPPDTPDAWARLKPADTEKVEGISFAPVSTEIKDFEVPTLQGLADRLNAQPRYYVEIRGVIKGTTPEDADLAKKRAEEVAKWLQNKGGVVEKRMRAVTVKPGPDAKAGTVVFAILEER